MYFKLFLALFFMFLLPIGVDAGRYQERPCSMYGSDGAGCDQCFDGGAKYVGDVFTPDDYFNAGDTARVYWEKENLTRYEFKILNNQTDWYVSNNLLGYPPTFLWYTANNGDRYYLFEPYTSTRFLATRPGKGITLQSVSSDSVSPTEPAMRFTFIANYRDFLGPGQQGSLQSHKECVFYQPRYCGDGILQTDKGEVCDPNDPNQVGWGNGGCDANTCQPINNPSCNALTVNPNSGDAPLDVSTTCEGFKVNTWEIDCGNGQVFSGNGNNAGTQSFSRTCRYTEAGNFRPRCTINGSITNNSCRKTVSVTTPLDPSISVDKTDANPHDLDGEIGNDTQTVYKGERAVFRIRVTNNGNEMLRNIRLTDPKAPGCATRGNTTVDLENNRFTNINNQVIQITQGGAGNKNDNRLAPGEWFEYICSEPDSQSDYINTVGTTGVGITTGRTVSDTDPTAVIVVDKPKPRIEVDKRDANPNDLDGDIGGNDSQTVRPGDPAIFSIVVTNNGSEDLEDIILIDEKAPACATADGTFVDLENKRFTNKLGETVHIDVFGQGNHTDNIFQVGEKFGYTCEEPDTQENYTNVVEVIGTGITSRKTVTDDDSTAVVIETKPSIRVIKLDANPNDLDGEKFNDTQTVLRGTEAIFHIRVVNNGAETLRNIVLIDPVAPACATADGTFVDLENKRFTNQFGQVVNITLDGLGNHNNNTLETGEEFTYTCSRDDTQEDYTNTVDVEGTGIVTGENVNDTDTTIVLVVDKEPKISIDKTDANPDDLDGIPRNNTQTVNIGDRAVFEITVSNTGSEPLKNVRLTDEKAPACATADGTFVNFIDNIFINKLGNEVEINLTNPESGLGSDDEFKTGAFFTYLCDEGDTQNDYINTVRVDAIGVDTEEGVHDNDDTIILVKEDDEDSFCLDLSASPSSAVGSLTSTLTCSGTEDADTFRIEVRNPSGEIVNTINSASGQVTLPLIGGTTTNYTASCFVNNEENAIPACRTNLTVTPGGGGGGADFACNDIVRTGNTYRCIGTGRQMNQFGILFDIEDESERQSLTASASDLTSFPGRRFADFSLPEGATNVQCFSANVGDTSRVGIGDTWRTSEECKYRPGGNGGGGPFCGDGIVQPPEECDLGPLNGQPGSPCTADCRLVRDTPPPTCSELPPAVRDVICGIETIPGEAIYSFGPNGTVVVGHQRNPLFELRGIPMLANNSTRDIAFDRICVSSDPSSGTESKSTIVNDGSLNNQEICVDIEGRKIYPFEELYIVRDGDTHKVVNQYANISRDNIDIYPIFVGDINNIPDDVRDYGTAQVRTSVYSEVQGQNFSFYHTFLSGNVDVRVVKPAVSTVGGGTSFVGQDTTSDVAKVTDGISGLFKGTNFVGTSVSEPGISSDAGIVTDTSTSQSDRDMQDGTSIITGTDSTEFINYNNIENVFIKTGNHTFSGTPIGNGARTYIIDDGDVTISGDIISNDNIAIIVRDGNITINNNVERIDATLMILGDGKISGDESEKQLRVNGALYGNIDELVNNRYFIDGSGTSLSVGTIVSFGSNLLRRPAPLLSQFVSEYLNSQRVAR